MKYQLFFAAGTSMAAAKSLMAKVGLHVCGETADPLSLTVEDDDRLLGGRDETELVIPDDLSDVVTGAERVSAPGPCGLPNKPIC